MFIPIEVLSNPICKCTFKVVVRVLKMYLYTINILHAYITILIFKSLKDMKI